MQWKHKDIKNGHNTLVHTNAKSVYINNSEVNKLWDVIQTNQSAVQFISASITVATKTIVHWTKLM